MSEIYEIAAEARTISGKSDNRRLRRLNNQVPAIVYGAEKEPVMISLDHNAFSKALENEAFYSHILTLSINGKKEKVVLKDLHRHPSKPKILHADFLRISAKTKITMLIPLHFKGGEVSPGVKSQGGQISHLMGEVEVRCLPGDLPEFIEVDLSGLSIGDSILLSELTLPKGVESVLLLQGEEFDQPVASLHKPTIMEEPEEVAPAAEGEEEETPEASAPPKEE